MDKKEQKKYKTAFIYCIKSYQTDDIYIGSTAQRLSKRLSQHKRDYKAYLNDKYHYVTSYEIVKYEDCYIELIETLNDVNKMEMHKIEGTYIKNTDCINKCIMGRTQKEYQEKYRDQNKEKIKEYQEKYRDQNKEQIKEHNKEYYKENAEKIKEQKKEYIKNNAEKIKEKKRQYKQNNKDKITQKHDCLCGGKYLNSSKARHERTQMHINYIQNN